MTTPPRHRNLTASVAAALSLLGGIATGIAAPDDGPTAAASSTQQGQTSLDETFDPRQKQLQNRGDAWQDTTLSFNFRTYYLDRNNLNGSENEAWAAGGFAGLTTGYFLDHVAFGLTGYTSQHLQGGDDTDGTLLLAPGQEGYSVLGELYTDIRIMDDLHLLAGRKGYDTPFINRNDTRMTPNTFEAVVLQGHTDIGGDGAGLKFGAGYFDSIKERNSDEFTAMSVDAGATVERGVVTAGARYQKGNFSIGAIDYYSADIINIGYFETKLEVPVRDDWKLMFAAQYADQRSVGGDLLTGSGFTARQFGLKAELDAGPALFTTAFTSTSGNADMQNPWSGYPGYTSSQIEDFYRDGEAAFLLRAGYEFTAVRGLSAYVLGVFGTTPDQAGQYRQDEYDFNLQWAAPEGVMNGLSLRMRYAIVDQHGGNADNANEFRITCNYVLNF